MLTFIRQGIYTYLGQGYYLFLEKYAPWI